MLFIIHGLDKPGALERRLAAYDAHKAHIGKAESYGLAIVMSGPLVEDDGTTMKGSFFLCEAPSREHVERFTADDPFRAADVWQGLTITAFHRRVG